MNIGDVVTVYVGVTNDLGDIPVLTSGMLGGYTLGGFLRTDGSNYTLTFTVSEGGTDYPAGASIPVSNLVLTDAAGNASAVWNSAISQANDPIDADRPTASITGTTTICADGNTNISISLTGNAPWDIIYQRDGANNVAVTGIVTSPYVFNTSTAGGYTVLSATESTGNTATSLGGTAAVTVNPLPVINDLDLNPLYNFEDDPDTLFPDPAGGTFSGTGIVGSTNTFHPDIAGVGGPYTITYTYTDGNGCTNSGTANTQVVLAGGSINGFNPSWIHCYDEDTFSISATSGAGGTAYAFGGPGVTTTSDSTGWFDTQLAGDGTHTISYKYYKDSVLFTISENVTVDSIGFPWIDTVYADYCISEPILNPDPEYTLLARDFSPPGGTHLWTGLAAGLTANGDEATIRTVEIGTGTHTITYTYTSPLGCSVDTSVTFNIHPLPTVSFTLRARYDLQETLIPLSGSPAGGTFTGKGTAIDSDSSIFNPSAVGVNPEYEIVYSYSDTNSCTNYDTNTVDVRDYGLEIIGLRTVSGRNIYCYDGGVDTIYAHTTSGEGIQTGTWTGSGIVAQFDDTAAVFDPVVAGYNGGADHSVAYTYTNEYGAPNSYSFKIAVDSIYPVYIDNLLAEYCVNDPVYDEDPTYDLTAENHPEGGTHLWSGLAAGLTQSGDEATIRTAVIGSGSHQITYEYTSIYSCKRDTTESFIIHPLPAVSFSMRARYDLEETLIPLSGSPAGGTFSGGGAAVNSDNSTFNPSAVGVNPGYNIVYTYRDGNNCVNYDTNTVDVREYGLEIIGLRTVSGRNIYCYDGGVDTIYAHTTSGEGIQTGTWSGSGIVAQFDDTAAVFDPVVAGYNGGLDHTITYTYTNEYGAPDEYIFNIAVDSIYPVYIDNLLAEYCVNDPVYDEDPTYDLTAENHPEGGTHLWSGLAAGLTQSGDEATIRTAVIGSGSHQITYEYTSIYSCKRDTTESFIIHPLPAVSFSMRVRYDLEETFIPLSGSPAGGTFSGGGAAVNSDNSTFNPSAVGVNPGYNIVYTYRDGNNCVNYDTNTVDVREYGLEIIGLRTVSGRNIYCYDGGVDTIYARTTTDEGIQTGTWSGAGIVAQFDDTAAVFDPVVAGYNGGLDHTITYTYTNEYGAPGEYIFNIAVDSIYPVYIDNLLAEYCVNEPVEDDDPSYTLTAENHPAGGTHLWSGLAAGLTQSGDEAAIRTAVIGNGSHQITYEYTSIYNCKRDTSESFTIHPLPDVTIEDTIRVKYDVAETSIPLTGYPAGGTWIGSGTAIDNDNQIFNPSAVGINPEYDIKYKSFEIHPGATCYNYDTLTVEIYDFTIGFNGLRKVSGNNVYCYDGETDTIWAYTTDIKGRIVSGTFSGDGIIENINDSVAVFDPVIAGAGDNIITYTSTNNYGSMSSVPLNITVDSVGMVAFVGLQDDYCISDGLYQLTVSQAGSFLVTGTLHWLHRI
jgi:hypothetical protein